MKNHPKKKTILVVDDEEQICNVIKKVLLQEGYQIFTAFNGETALNQLKKSSVDLMLVDLKMPSMNGLELLQQARTIQKNLKSILLTAYGTASAARDAMFLGVFDFLTKPFDIQLLKKVVKEALGDQR
ncbi:MAG: response regulator [Deltaproteobacteria bacterium]|nr:response regulator [Deltaproteobacteria bacterium]